MFPHFGVGEQGVLSEVLAFQSRHIDEELMRVTLVLPDRTLTNPSSHELLSAHLFFLFLPGASLHI